MGTGVITIKNRKNILYLIQDKIEFTPPNNEKAKIGIYMFEEFSHTNQNSLEIWTKLLKNYKSTNPIESLLTDTQNCKILTNYIKKGIPIQWRWQTWKSYINLSIISEINYKNIPLSDIELNEIIKKDINRTFPEHKFFDISFYGYYGQYSLYRILGKFASAYSEVGYCQGMNFIVGFLLIVSGGNEIECYCMLEAIIFHFNIRRFYTEEMLELKKYLEEFNGLFQKNLKHLYWHFKINEITEDMWLVKWFMTLFTAVLPLNVVVNIWDILMVDGISILPYIALAILKYFESELLGKDAVEILEFFNALRYLRIHPEIILKPVINTERKPKSNNSGGRIFPFVHPRSTENILDHSKEIEIRESLPSGIITMQCEITEDPKELPFAKTQSILPKHHGKILYKNSLNYNELFEVSTIVDSKPDESFDPFDILNDLITEDFE